MKFEMQQSVSLIKGIGPNYQKQLQQLHINTMGDLLYYFPRTWINFSKPVSIANLRINDVVVIKAKIIEIQNQITYRRRISITKALAQDDTGQIYCQWFNQPYIPNTLKKDSVWIIFGKVGYDFQNKEKIINVIKYTKEQGIIPIYSESDKLKSNFFTKTIKNIIEKIKIDEYLPDEIIQNNNLISLQQALVNIHFPMDNLMLVKSKRRLAFDELFFLSLKTIYKKYKFKLRQAPQIITAKNELLKLTKSLPFKLTLAQNKALYEILTDISSNHPMIRLLNGDVGSGKTIIAIIASYIAAINNYQSVIMAPTTILASQHYDKFTKTISNISQVKIALVTSNIMKANFKLKNNDKKQIISQADIIIGTHALIQKDMIYERLGIVIIDEEHRFGVKQRAKLIKLNNKKTIPHYLSLSATAIPRTLAQTVYGNMDVSVIDQMPSGRKQIVTKLVDSGNRNKAYEFVKNNIKNGRQVFIICPLIDDNKENQDLLGLDKKTVLKEYNKLKKEIFPEYKIAYLHGKMKAKEKERIIQDFACGKSDILVSTSVIEVGVDIPNTNIIIIEDADKFGLAQLHQFRGRVGRGLHQSYCLLFSTNDNIKTQKRLRAMEKYSDGFKLANIDLATRGPGEFIGCKQSGFLDLKIASITDTITLNQAKHSAKEIINNNIENYPALYKIIIDDKSKK